MLYGALSIIACTPSSPCTPLAFDVCAIDCVLAAVAWCLRPALPALQGGSRRRQLLAPRALLGAATEHSTVATTLGDLAGSAVGGESDEPMYMVVGFEVMACSIARVAGQKPKDISCIDTLEGKPPAPQEITKGMGRSGDRPTARNHSVLPDFYPSLAQIAGHIILALCYRCWHHSSE